MLLVFASATHVNAQVVAKAVPANAQYITKWNTTGGTPDINNSQIYDAGISTTGGIGINTTSPASYLHVVVPHGSSVAENCIQATVDDASGDYFKICNLTSVNGTFASLIRGHIQTANTKTPLFLIGSVDTSLDNAGNGVPLMAFDARATSSAILHRPLFAWNNFGIMQMQMSAKGYLGIGTSTPTAQINNVLSADSSTLIGIRTNTTITTGSGSDTAIIGFANSLGSGNATGVYGYSSDTGGTNSVSTGVKGYANIGSGNHSKAYGVWGTTDSSGSNNTFYGGYFKAGGTTGGTNTFYAGYFVGDGHATGNWTWVSDQNLKDNIKPLTNGLQDLMKLEPKTYVFKTNQYPGMRLAQGPQMGLISQDVEKIFPNLVKNEHCPETHDKNGKVISPAVDYKGMNYIELIPVIISSIKQQQDTITKQQSIIQQQQGTIAAQATQNAQLQSSVNDLQDKFNTVLAQIEELKTIQAQCCGSTGSNLNNGGTGNDKAANDQPTLEQNVPNPFNTNTVINYYLPTNITNAVITVRALTGVTLQSFNLTGVGFNKITVAAGTLAPGTYEYDMIANGKLIDSKKMVIVGQ